MLTRALWGNHCECVAMPSPKFLEALAPTIPGAALCRAHADDPAYANLEVALKGGQMGSPDYFGWIRDGGGDTPRGSG